MSRRFLALVPAVLLGACSVVGIRSGTEEPKYSVVAKLGTSVEIRQYGPRLAAETIETGGQQAALRAGFERIAGFIFGQNTGKAQIAMTAPVSQTPGSQSGASIAMTAPVASTPAGQDAWRVRFFMPAKYTLATLPHPTDPQIKIVTVPAETFAVYRYSGIPSVHRTMLARRDLMKALDGSGWLPRGEPIDWYYDPPWTIPPLRRNEAAVLVERAPGGN